jgi:hypothetical protein
MDDETEAREIAEEIDRAFVATIARVLNEEGVEAEAVSRLLGLAETTWTIDE